MTTVKDYKSSYKEFHILAEIAETLTSHLNLRDLLQEIIQKVIDTVTPADFGVIFLWDPNENALCESVLFGNENIDLDLLLKMKLQMDESVFGKVYSTQEAQILSIPQKIEKVLGDLHEENQKLIEKAFLGSNKLSSILVSPLTVNSHEYGVLVLGSLDGQIIFTSSDLSFIMILAELIARAIDRSRLEGEIARVLEDEHFDRLRAETLAVLSHELRTPLAAIKGYSTALLLDEVEWEKEKRIEFLELIDEECDNLQTMITDILDSSLIDIGQITLEYQPVRFEKIIPDVADEMQRRTEKHKIVVDFPQIFPIVDADPLRIRQIVRNIIDNSIKYSQDGGLIVIRGEVRPADVVISISDQGVGISPEDLIPLFDKYFRVKSSTGYYVPGTGLGLPVARGLVEEHNGRIWAESKVGEGTTLYFSIPQQKNEDDE